ncbi:hypothetical protein [Microcoleus sp. FACHB-1515]|nr:hypothetical protein [Microcoleus sp. FACHB-1515]
MKPSRCGNHLGVAGNSPAADGAMEGEQAIIWAEAIAIFLYEQ